MPDDIDLFDVDFITIGTIGPPGKRVFHLQARKDAVLLTLIIEKGQAAALAEGILSLLDTVQQEFGRATPEVEPGKHDLELQEPILPHFRVGQMGLGYDSDADRVVLVMGELQPEDSPYEPRTVRLSASREHMHALALHARWVVEQGRPICPHCGEPIDPDGHFCPKSNGHRRPVIWA